MITHKEVKMVVAILGGVVFAYCSLFGWPLMPSSLNQGAKLQSLMRVVN